MMKAGQLRWTLAYCIAPLALIFVSVVGLTGCGAPPKSRKPQLEVWDDMRRQEKFKPQAETSLFDDKRQSRRPVAGTVARGQLKQNELLETGFEKPDLYTGKMPVTLDADLMKLGQARYNVYCTPCHDRAGTGKGSVALKAPQFLPANLHDDRIKHISDGDIYNTITNGKRSMPAYKFQVTNPKDRWAIVAYVRALQRMSSGSVDDVPADMRTSLSASKSQSLLPPPPPPPAPPAAAGSTAPAGAAAAPAGGQGK